MALANGQDARPLASRATTEALHGKWAFGVDPTRRERYSLRQSRYAALAEDINAWAGAAPMLGEHLSLLDVGCGWGALLRHLEGKPNFAKLKVSATDLSAEGDTFRYNRGSYHEFFIGDLMEGYPDIPSGQYDIVVCEQVLEHLDNPDAAIETLIRLVRPGGKLVIGVPIFLPPLHLARTHLVPRFARFLRHPVTASHRQAFSLASLLRRLKRRPELTIETIRGFRIVSGGVLRPLENYHWWWKLNQKIGALIPAACIEVQAVLAKSNSPLDRHQLTKVTGLEVDPWAEKS